MTNFRQIIAEDIDNFYAKLAKCPGCVLVSHDLLNRLQATIVHPLLRLISEGMSNANQLMCDHARASINMCILRHVDAGNIILKPDGDLCELVLSPNAITCGSEHERASDDRSSGPSNQSSGPTDSGPTESRESVREIYDRLVTKFAR